MKFLFIINKWANFYFFVQNLSEWHFSNRKKYNQIWKKELGPLSFQEKKALKKFKNIHLKYPFEKKYLGQFFYSEKDPWKMLGKQLSKKELSALRNIFSIFQSKFEILYKKDLPLLKKWQKTLQEKANNKSLINSINKTLSTLYNVPLLRGDVKVYLLFSPTSNFGGGSSTGDKAITLEISRLPLKKVKPAIGAIWHETIHLYYEKAYFLPLLDKVIPGDQESKDLIQEATTRMVSFPGGFLDKKVLQSRNTANNLPQKHLQPLADLKSLISNYIQKNKSLDKDYIKKALIILSDLRGEIY